jgi:hypothetical protein
MEGEEIQEPVRIPTDTSSKTNTKNSDLMMFKDMGEAERQNILHNNHGS